MASSPRGKCRTEQLCVNSWYRSWSPAQRDRFLRLLRQETALQVDEDDLLASFTDIDLSGRVTVLCKKSFNTFLPSVSEPKGIRIRIKQAKMFTKKGKK
jgi:hypothetical protein